MRDPKGSRQLVEGDDRRIPAALFEAADILLAEAGDFGELFLCQPFPLSDPPNVLPDQLAHVHAPRSADYALEVYQL